MAGGTSPRVLCYLPDYPATSVPGFSQPVSPGVSPAGPPWRRAAGRRTDTFHACMACQREGSALRAGERSGEVLVSGWCSGGYPRIGETGTTFRERSGDDLGWRANPWLVEPPPLRHSLIALTLCKHHAEESLSFHVIDFMEDATLDTTQLGSLSVNPARTSFSFLHANDPLERRPAGGLG